MFQRNQFKKTRKYEYFSKLLKKSADQCNEVKSAVFKDYKMIHCFLSTREG